MAEVQKKTKRNDDPTHTDWYYVPEIKPVGNFLSAADIDADELLGGIGFKDRVDGLIARYVDQFLGYDINGLITKIAQQAVVLSYLVLYQDQQTPFQPGQHAYWPRPSGPHGLNVPERIGDLARYVAKETRLRAQRLRPDRVAYAHPHDLFFLWPHAPATIKYLIDQDEEAKKAVATAVKLKTVLTSDTRDSLINGVNVRSYRNEHVSSGDVSTINRNLLTIGKTRVAVQGGGELTKEITIFKADNIVSNLELNHDGQVEERDINGTILQHTPAADTVVSFESQLRPGTLENDELMLKTGATFAISSVATDKSDKAREVWRETDDPQKVALHLAKRKQYNVVLTNDEKHQIEFDMAPCYLTETGTSTGTPRSIGPLKGQVEPTTVIPGGNITIKKKINGVNHRLEIANGLYSIFPRVFETEEILKETGNSYSSSGTASTNINLACDLEITKDRVFHVVRVYEVNSMATSGLTAISACVHQNLSITGLTRCDLAKCVCPTDGIVIDKDGVEYKYEDVVTKDVRRNETVYPVLVNAVALTSKDTSKFECVPFSKMFKSSNGGPEAYEGNYKRLFPTYVMKRDDRNPSPLLPSTPFLRKLLGGVYAVRYKLNKHLAYKGGTLPEYGPSVSGTCACTEQAQARCSCGVEFCPMHPCTACNEWEFTPDRVVRLRAPKDVCMMRCKSKAVIVCQCDSPTKQRRYCLNHFQQSDHDCAFAFTGIRPPAPADAEDGDDEE